MVCSLRFGYYRDAARPIACIIATHYSEKSSHAAQIESFSVSVCNAGLHDHRCHYHAMATGHNVISRPNENNTNQM